MHVYNIKRVPINILFTGNQNKYSNSWDTNTKLEAYTDVHINKSISSLGTYIRMQYLNFKLKKKNCNDLFINKNLYY